MIAITSIAPKHVNEGIQAKAVESWIACGLKVYSINSKSECRQLQPLYPDVTFIPTNRTMELTYGKPYPSINAIFDWCKDQDNDHFCIINSDIELKGINIEGVKREMETSIVLANRVNHNGDYKGAQYLHGIDAFFIHKKWIFSFAQTTFCIGQCHYDYWIPYSASQKGIPITFIRQDVAFHLNHAAQYSSDNWLKTGRYLIWECNLYQFNSTQDIGRMSTFVFNYIYTNAKRKEL